jgi:gamma-glutamylcyclotransferase (GGCT)/AIG2-like uncharacterized protein YtfP
MVGVGRVSRGLPLFVYGTLLSSTLRKQLIDRRVPVSEAWLAGYRVARIAGRGYPGLVPSTQDRANGVLLDGLGPLDFKRLDRYEGLEYSRVVATAQTPRGRRRVWVYLPRKGVVLTEEDWSPSTIVQPGR